MANERNLNTFGQPPRRLVTGCNWVGAGAVLLFLAALALPLSASAQEGQVSIYGALHPFLDNYRTTGASAKGSLSPDDGAANQVIADDYTGENLPNRYRMTSGTSHIGFRGEMRLTEHVKAFFQVEAMVNLDGDAPVLTNPWASRNSAVGMTGDYGTFFFGNWDTPYKYPTLFVGALRGLNPFDNTLTGNPGFNVPGTTVQNGRASTRADAAFNRRQGNSIQYWSPTWYGVSVRLAGSLNEGRTMATEIEPSVSPSLWSAFIRYDRGPLTVHYAYELHLDYFGLSWVGGSPGASLTNRSSRDDAHEIVAWYTLPTNTRVAGIIERLTYRSDETGSGLLKGYQRDAAYGAVQQRFGRHQFWGAIGIAGSGRCTLVGGGACTTNGLKGRQWSLGYTFSPAKSFDIYASYYEMNNGRSATYGLYPAVVPVAPGVTTRGFGVGLFYMFDVTMGVGSHTQASDEPAMPPAAADAASPEPPVTPPAEATKTEAGAAK